MDALASEIANKDVLVAGLDEAGIAACLLLRRQGARVFAMTSGAASVAPTALQRLRELGITLLSETAGLPPTDFALAVLSPDARPGPRLERRLQQAKMRLLTELELGMQTSRCLTLALSGTNGKSTTAGLIERMLKQNNRRTLVCGQQAPPLCAVVEQTWALDYLVLQVDSWHLAAARFIRPSVAVLLNLAPGYRGRHADAGQYVRAHEVLFAHQQFFDWAIVQSGALRRCRELGLPMPAKTITFSATEAAADLCLDRGLLVSRLPNWPGPLLDLDHCLLRGPHNAENLMAALAVGHVLRLPLESMVDALKTFAPGPHRCQLVAEINGVQFIDDSKAGNVEAMEKAVLAARSGRDGEPNVWLIAGGDHSDADFHRVGPVLSRRVKGAFLIGEINRTIRSAWSLFTPCQLAASLLEAVAEAARNATSGDVVLLSPACSGLDQFRNHQHRGQSFCEAVKSIGRGEPAPTPYINGLAVPA